MSVVGRAKQVMPRAVREAARGGVRTYGAATAASRVVPDFLVIGTKRGGTTSLWNYLVGHPGVVRMWPVAERLKSPHYFDLNATRSEAWYRSHFPTTGQLKRLETRLGYRPVTGEASPYYLLHPAVPARVRAVMPAVKLVVLLRDPVERAYSHYKERVRQGIETLPFMEALLAEGSRIGGEAERLLADPAATSEAHDSFSYLARGRYLEQLERWYGEFPAEQLLVLQSEDFYRDPASTLATVAGFLGLPPYGLGEYRRWNYHPAADMPADARTYLQHYFVEPNAALESRLGRTFDWQEPTFDHDLAVGT